MIYGYFRVNNEYKEGKFMAFNKLLKVGAIAAAIRVQAQSTLKSLLLSVLALLQVFTTLLVVLSVNWSIKVVKNTTFVVQ